MVEFTEIIDPLTDIVVDHAFGTRVYAEDGREYLDFTSGIAVTSTGHCHPRVVSAIKRQAERAIHAQIRIVRSRPLLELIRRLGTVLPQPLDSIYLGNSGAEAIEAALRLARQATRRQDVIVFHGSFHGRTIAAASLTTSGTKVRAGVGPLMPGVHIAPFPDVAAYGGDADRATAEALSGLDYLTRTVADPRDIAAILIEPVLGEGGYKPVPDGFLVGLRARADEYGSLLIFDEIQSGYGRTGDFWASEPSGVMPDVLTMAKGMASGLPISAMATTSALMAKAWRGSQGGTFAGNPIACAAAVATLDVIRDERLLDNAKARGDELIAGLRAARTSDGVIESVRGRGLMVGVQMRPLKGQSAGAIATRLQRALLERGLLVLTCGPDHDALRLAPPLVATKEDISEGLAMIKAAVEDVGE